MSYGKLVFLDIDGVLNNHDFDHSRQSTTIHRDKIDRLNAIIVATGAKVVISSAWRYLVHRQDMTLSGLDWLMRSHGMRADSLVGITQTDESTRERLDDGSPSRAAQVEDWLLRCPGMAERSDVLYVVVDDLDLGFSASGIPFVQADPRVGLNAQSADRIIELLTRR